jgi:REP element-mobilizing transposase RayT
MKHDPVTLTKVQRRSATRAVMDEATKLGQTLFAVAVCDNHVHLVVQSIDLPIGRVASHYKNAIRLTLQGQGFRGKLWTRGFDKRYCMKDEELVARVAYVRNHKNTDAEIRIGLNTNCS